MNASPDLERRVTEWLRVEAPARAPERVLSATLDRVAVLGQERTLTRWRDIDRRGTSRAALIAATAALLATLIAGALFVGSQRRSDDAPLPVPPPAPVARIPGQGPALTWTRSDVIPAAGIGFDPTTTRVAWVADRFVMVDEDTQTVATSPDGSSWTTLAADDPDLDYLRVLAFPDPIAIWEDDVISWTPFSPGSGVRIRRPPDITSVAAFEGTVDAAAIGPAGIVVKTQTEFNQDAFFLEVLGPGWNMDTIESIGLQDGVVSLTTRDGQTASINLAEHGVDEWDFANRGEGWHSVDGKEWTQIPGFPANVFSIVGTPDGFLARGDPGTGLRMFHSPDGFAWRRMAIAFDTTVNRTIDPILLPWGAGALQSDGKHYIELWTAAGKRVLPMAAELPSERDPVVEEAGIGAGPLGIVFVDAEADEILFSPDGVEWRIQAMSDDMAQDAGLGRSPHSTNVAVGTDAVAVLLWQGTSDDGARPSLWVGTPAP